MFSKKQIQNRNHRQTFSIFLFLLLNLFYHSQVRPVVNIHWDDKDDKKEMEKVISILKFVKKQRPLVTGCAVSSISEIHHRLLNFSMKLRAMGRLGSKLYFLCSDIERCFDNMPHDKLLEVIRHSLKEKEYLVRNFRTICNVTHGVIKTKNSHAVAAAANCSPFPVFLKENLLSDDIRVRNSVIIDVGDEIRSRNRVISLITKHVEQSYVQFGNTFYRHIRGMFKLTANLNIISSSIVDIIWRISANSDMLKILFIE